MPGARCARRMCNGVVGKTHTRWSGHTGITRLARRARAFCAMSFAGSKTGECVTSKAEIPPASSVKAGGEIRLGQATAILELTLFAALAMSAATASGIEI